MANNTINFTINIDGNAYTGIAQIDAALGNVLVSAKNTKSFFESFKTSAFNFDVITNAIGKVSQACDYGMKNVGKENTTFFRSLVFVYRNFCIFAL